VLFCQDNQLVPEFGRCAASVTICDFGPSDSRPCRTLVERVRWPYDLTADVLLKQPRIHRMIREIRPDLVHLNNSYSSLHEWMLACRLSATPVVAHDRGTPCPCGLRTRLFVRLLDAVICVSDAFHANLTRQRLSVRSFRVYNGLDPALQTSTMGEERAAVLRQSLGVQGRPTIIGMVGNFYRYKGQMVVLQALRSVVEEHPDVVCLFVGKVPRGEEQYREELDTYVREHRLEANVRFVGYRENVAEILAIVDLVVSASTIPEAFGRVVVEGMAAGKPVIGPDAGGVAEIIVPEETGLLVPVNDPRALSESVRRLVRDPAQAKEMGMRGRKRLEEHFSAARMVRETEQVYERAVFGVGDKRAKSGS
jgi:glycosyltransferase involved in cell wall biosynthesis